MEAAFPLAKLADPEEIISPLPVTISRSAPPCWKRMNLPPPVSLIKMEGLVEESASADEGARVMDPPAVASVPQENFPVVAVQRSLAVEAPSQLVKLAP